MSSSRSAKEPKEAPPVRPGRRRSVLTLLLALYAAVVATALRFRGEREGPGAGPVASGDALDARFAAEARRLRGEVRDDVEKAHRASEERVARAVKQVEDARDSWRAAVETGARRADDVARNATTRSDQIDERVDDVEKAATEARAGVDGLKVAVRELQSRPASGPAAPAKPAVAPAKPPDGSATPPAAALTPEQIAANKEKVRAAIADLAAPDIARVFTAALLLGRSGDLEAAEPLSKVVRENKDPLARSASASALGTLHACDAMPTILGAFLDKNSGVFLAAGQAFAAITGTDAGLSGEATRRERTDAKERGTKWWHDHEAEIRQRLGQPAKAPEGGTPPPEPGATPPQPK